MDESKGSHRTRSKAAPDWTAEESLILVNEINAVESEWGATLPSFQKWQQIVENCNALEVSRNLNQCKRQWGALLSAYRRARNGEEANGSLPVELFKAIDRCVTARGKKTCGGGVQVEAETTEEPAAGPAEEQAVLDTDPDSDPEAQGRVTKFFIETGSKKQRRRMKRQKRRVERLTPWGYFTSPKIKQDETSTVHEKTENTNKHIVESAPEANLETKERKMATILWENALQINRILESKLVDDDESYKLADTRNAEAVQTDFTRRQGDKLIDSLGKISTTLNQLCDFIQQ